MAREVPLSDIVDNPFQPRDKFDRESIKSLADEIEVEGFWNGTLQGRRNARGQVELVYGHRRLRALRHLKRSSVRIELVDLTDAQMALRALEENLQREGLTDFEKADAVSQVIELEEKQRKKDGEEPRGVSAMIARRLGVSESWISQQRKASLTIVKEDRDFVDGAITAKTALAAKEWGGQRYMKTLVRQARAAAKRDAKISKPTEHTVAAMKRAVMAAPEDKRSKLEEKIFDGTLMTPEKVEQSARSLKAAEVRRTETPPPDLKVVIHGWTEDLNDWEKKLKTVLPYMDYVDQVPGVAKAFRAALRRFIETAEEILKASEASD
jgi:ParB/RepB/Spo0J family partition protein